MSISDHFFFSLLKVRFVIRRQLLKLTQSESCYIMKGLLKKLTDIHVVICFCLEVCKCAFSSTLALHTFRVFAEEMSSEGVYVRMEKREERIFKELLQSHYFRI